MLNLNKFNFNFQGYFSYQIDSLNFKLSEGINNKIEDKFFLFPLFPGISKSKTVKDFIINWKNNQFKPDTGVIIFLSTLKEIESYRKDCGLEDTDFAIICGDAKLNGWGLGSARSNNARVLFTTHEQLRRRTRNSNFAGISKFQYRGKPRSLRVWDEGFLPAAPIALSLDRIDCLKAVYRTTDSFLADSLDEWSTSIRVSETDATTIVPVEISDRLGIPIPRDTSDRDKGTIEKLKVASGREMLIRGNDYSGFTLLGTEPPIPADLAPLLILDGSGTCKATYRLWEQHNGNIRVMPKGRPRYDNMTLHWWERGASKGSLRNGTNRGKIVDAICNLIASKSEEDWLIIHPLRYLGIDIASEIEENLPPNAAVRFRNWGKHHGTNKFNYVRNVIIIGCYEGPDSHYTTLSMAASGLPVSDPIHQDVEAVKAGEIQSNLLQAISRINIRNIDHETGLCGHGNAYLIMPGNGERLAWIDEIFPGCRVIPWRPTTDKPTGKAGKVVDEIIRHLVDLGKSTVTKTEICLGAGLSRKQALTKIINKEAVTSLLEKHGIYIDRYSFNMLITST